jgi:hypothetical protein
MVRILGTVLPCSVLAGSQGDVVQETWTQLEVKWSVSVDGHHFLNAHIIIATSLLEQLRKR